MIATTGPIEELVEVIGDMAAIGESSDMALARIYDDAARKLEALKEQATGIERIRCINDILWVRTQRSYRGV